MLLLIQFVNYAKRVMTDSSLLSIARLSVNDSQWKPFSENFPLRLESQWSLRVGWTKCRSHNAVCVAQWASVTEVQWSLHNVKNTLWNSHGKHRGACAPSTGLHTMHSDHYAIARCFTIAMHHKLWFTNSWTTNADSHYANHKLWFTISTHNEYKQPKNNITRIWS